MTGEIGKNREKSVFMGDNTKGFCYNAEIAKETTYHL